jgi:flagellar protein FliO/FliZ
VASAGAAAPQAGASGSFLPGLAEGSFSWSGYFEALAVLCFGLALLWAALWLVRRFTAGKRIFSSSAPGLRIESRLALGPKKWIFVARFLDRRLVLGVTEQNITLLTEVFLDDDSAGEVEKRKSNATMAPPASSSAASSQPGGESAAAGRFADSGLSPSGAGRTGKADDPADLARAVKDVLGRLGELKDRIRSDAALQERFSWAGQVPVLERVYSEVLASR